MRALILPLTALALAACSSEPAPQESADDFASRINGGEQGAAAPVDADAPNVAAEAPPAGVNVTQLEQLRDIANVDMGPRDGGCTFMDGNRELVMASALREPTLPGKAVIRVGGGLTLLDTGPGGLDSLKAGATFSGEGVTVQVAPQAGDAASRAANLTVSAADGSTATYSGKWICA
ncbi:hypothetical protein GRI34_04270 [Erythrobacter aquimaris]|uniref:Uncharacterized protein n=1 Tax=Qipengyuania aquimaris TaxID=255984 RepID=A0A6I4TI91_9SPHN|nr:hypothetical protein [Qipengyuania aquimaris]MXO95635.1 hypothetical protein [Qipengyuania aquimaris]